MSLILINNLFIMLMIVSLIVSVIDKKIKQSCLVDLLAVLGSVFGVAMISTATDLNYTLVGTLFRCTICVWVVVSVYRKFVRSRQNEQEANARSN